MQIDSTIYSRVARMDLRKANRLRAVSVLPESAEQGDIVVMGGQMHYYLDNTWHGVDDVLGGQLQALGERITALEDNGGDGDDAAEPAGPRV